MTIVRSYGPHLAKIAVVGEAPGSHEVRLGRPFVGPAGSLLRTMLSDAGVIPASVRYLNVMETQPSRNNFAEFYYDKARQKPKPELLQGQSRLRKELQELKPNVTIACGNEPLVALTGKRGIKKWRGSILATDVGKVIPTLHPAAILRMYSDRPIAQIDVTRAARESSSPDVRRPALHTICGPSLTQVLTWLHENHDANLCTFDTETLGRFIRCLGLSVRPDEAICIPFMRVNAVQIRGKTIIMAPQRDNPSYWSPQDETAIISALSRFFASTKTRFVAQNFSFDVPLMERNWRLRVPHFYLDTMHAQHVAYPEFPMSLDFLTSVYTRIGYYADYDPSDDRETWEYNGLDCMATFQCIEPILAELEALGLKDFYFHHIHPLVLAMTRIQERGVLIDVKRRTELGEPIRKEIDALRQRFADQYGVKVNKVVSPKQVKSVLTGLGIPIPTRNFKQTTDERAMSELIVRYPDFPFLKDVLTQREKVKFYGTYVTAELDEDNRMRTSYNVSGTKTGRLSSSKTLWDTGGNLQNIPRGEFRRLFIAPPGKVFMHADLSQAETRLVAWFSRNEALIERFLHEPGFDVHIFKAMELYKVLAEAVTEEQRYNAKQCNHSGNYKIGWKKFSYISGIPPSVARPLLQAHQSDRHLQWWWADVQARLRASRTLVTPAPFLRKRIFYGRLDEETFREAYNCLPQSTVADVINEAVWKLDAALDPALAVMVLQLHDEIDFEVDEKRVLKAAQVIRNALEIELIVHDDLPPLTIPVEITYGPNWYDQPHTTLELERFDP